MQTEFTDSVALITGSSRGVGRATARYLAQRGAKVVINYRNTPEQARSLAEEIGDLGTEALVIRADLEDPDQIDAMFDQIHEHFGKLDIFVANAASTAFKDLIDVKPHHLHRTFAITLDAFVQGVQRAASLMDRGRIVAVSGLDAHRYLPKHGVLGAAKSALETLVGYWACELGPQGITVNGVCPGLIASDSGTFYADVMGIGWQTLHDRYAEQTPLRRIATPEDIAKVIGFFCSQGAAMITGQTLVVDGGLMVVNPA
ncbi:MAG: SDR family oxidoreductase [Trueperaceae bacterium]|nr:MAG: SDR family oxidoreductase [Trueperaceae bacterium]